MTSDNSTTSSSSSLDVPYALDLSLDKESSSLEFESPERQQLGREPLRVGDVIAYTCPVFTAGAAYGRREATVVGVDPTHIHFPLVLDNCESLPWDTFVQRIGEFYKGRVRRHPGRQKPISRFLLKASGTTTNQVLAATLQKRASKYKEAMQKLETEAVRVYAGRTANDKSKVKLGLFPTVPRRKPKVSKELCVSSEVSRGNKTLASHSGQRPLTTFFSSSSSEEFQNHDSSRINTIEKTKPSATHQLDLEDSDSLSESSSLESNFRTQSPSTWLAHTKAKSRTKETGKSGTESESSGSLLCSPKTPFYVRPTSPPKLEPIQPEAPVARPVLSFTKQNNHKSKATSVAQQSFNKHTTGITQSATNVSRRSTLKRHHSTIRTSATSLTKTRDMNMDLERHNDTTKSLSSRNENGVNKSFDYFVDSDSDDMSFTGKDTNPNTKTTSSKSGQFQCKKRFRKEVERSFHDMTGRPDGRSIASQRQLHNRINAFHSSYSNGMLKGTMTMKSTGT